MRRLLPSPRWFVLGALLGAWHAWALRMRARQARFLTHGPTVDVVRLEPLSGIDRAVDHTRVPGVPPSDNDDYLQDLLDFEGAQSFPASDPDAKY